MCRQQTFAQTDPCRAARQIPKPHYPHSLNTAKFKLLFQTITQHDLLKISGQYHKLTFQYATFVSSFRNIKQLRQGNSTIILQLPNWHGDQLISYVTTPTLTFVLSIHH